MEVPIYDFPIKAYSQNPDDYLPKEDNDYTKSLVKPGYQIAQLQQFYNHYYASDTNGLSPWSEEFIRAILPTVKKVEENLIEEFNNQNQPVDSYHYAENFKEHDTSWFRAIKQNMALETLNSADFNEKNKAIAVANTFARALPDDAPDFLMQVYLGKGFLSIITRISRVCVDTSLYY